MYIIDIILFEKIRFSEKKKKKTLHNLTLILDLCFGFKILRSFS